jgi:hypothetical protein
MMGLSIGLVSCDSDSSSPERNQVENRETDGDQSGFGDQSGLTYYTDIQPMLNEKCVSCHQQGGIGPFSLESYQQVKALSASIKSAVTSGRMPIWLAESGHQEYVDDPSFSEQELAQLVSWIDAGSPEGNPPADPVTQPDVTFPADLDLSVLPAGQSYLPAQDQKDDYRCFIVELPELAVSPSYITGFHTEPGNKAVAHHLVAYVANQEIVDKLKVMERDEPGAGYQCFTGGLPDRLGDPQVVAEYADGDPDFLQRLEQNHYWLAHWAPGMHGFEFPEGTGVQINDGSALIVQMHYYTGHAKGEADEGTRVKLQLAEKVEKPGFYYPLTNPRWLAAKTNESMVIEPKSSGEFRVTRSLAAIVDYGRQNLGLGPLAKVSAIEVHSANLHMHSFGESGQVYLQKAGSERQTLLSIPEWDLAWQRDFLMVEPKVIADDELSQYQLEVACQFYNPNDEPVYGGYGSDDEMCFNFGFMALRLAP